MDNERQQLRYVLNTSLKYLKNCVFNYSFTSIKGIKVFPASILRPLYHQKSPRSPLLQLGTSQMVSKKYKHNNTQFTPKQTQQRNNMELNSSEKPSQNTTLSRHRIHRVSGTDQFSSKFSFEQLLVSLREVGITNTTHHLGHCQHQCILHHKHHQ